ncbi:hypothetical protein PVK62_17510, partial [Aliivibrio sp. S3MY1]|uniref:hypothetical protein n=1 Tax=unclassified Aliivibrio TaxID=2645654 RepID=UPI002379CC20
SQFFGSVQRLSRKFFRRESRVDFLFLCCLLAFISSGSAIDYYCQKFMGFRNQFRLQLFFVLPHFSLHQCFARGIFNPNCCWDIWFISLKLAETRSYKWRKKKGLFRFTVIGGDWIFCSLN